MNDIRVKNAMIDIRINDTSFTERGLFGFTPKYTQSQVREYWFMAMEMGIKKGLEMGSIQGQRITHNTCKNDRQKEFIDKFYELAEKYNCAIVYHPTEGICIMDLDRN